MVIRHLISVVELGSIPKGRTICALALVAQWIEQRSSKPWVGGSSPPKCANIKGVRRESKT